MDQTVTTKGVGAGEGFRVVKGKIKEKKLFSCLGLSPQATNSFNAQLHGFCVILGSHNAQELPPGAA